MGILMEGDLIAFVGAILYANHLRAYLVLSRFETVTAAEPHAMKIQE